MKINIVSDATYYPVRIGQDSKKSPTGSTGSTPRIEQTDKFNKLLIDKLSPSEAAAIKKLFGDFNVNTASEPNNGKNVSDKKGNALRGRFVDITV